MFFHFLCLLEISFSFILINIYGLTYTVKPLLWGHPFLCQKCGFTRGMASNQYFYLKVRGPFVQTLCIEKDSYIDAIKRVNIFRWCFVIPKQGKHNTFWTPPKRLKDTNGRYMSTCTSVFLYNQPVTWIFTRSRLSSLSDSDYKVIPSLKIII